jgi:hypothetical protein
VIRITTPPALAAALAIAVEVRSTDRTPDDTAAAVLAGPGVGRPDAGDQP